MNMRARKHNRRLERMGFYTSDERSQYVQLASTTMDYVMNMRALTCRHARWARLVRFNGVGLVVLVVLLPGGLAMSCIDILKCTQSSARILSCLLS